MSIKIVAATHAIIIQLLDDWAGHSLPQTLAGKVTESAFTHIAVGVILNMFSSDGHLTVAKASTMAV